MDVDEKTREMNAIDARNRVLEDENLALKQEIDEKDAVIAACRLTRDLLERQRTITYRAWVETDDDPVLGAKLDVLDGVVKRLNAVDGL